MHGGDGVAPTALVDVDSSPDDDAFTAEVRAEVVGERVQAELLEDKNCEAIGSVELEAMETAVADLTALVEHIDKAAEVLNWDGFVEIDAIKDGSQ